MKNGAESRPARSIAASEIESIVLGQVRRLLRSPEVAARTVAACIEASGGDDAAAREREVLDALGRLDEMREEMFPAEQTRILRLLVEGIDVAPDGIDVRLRTAGIHSLVGELIADGGDGRAEGAEAPTEDVAA